MCIYISSDTVGGGSIIWCTLDACSYISWDEVQEGYHMIYLRRLAVDVSFVMKFNDIYYTSMVNHMISITLISILWCIAFFI